MKTRLTFAALLCALGLHHAFPATVTAQTPTFLKFLKATKDQPQQGANLELKTEHGPWLIYVASMEGPESKMQAVRLAAELREEHGLTSYIMPKTLDYTGTVYGSGFDKEGGVKRMKYSDSDAVESFSILVGDFTDVESPVATATLKKIKSLQTTEPAPRIRHAFFTRNPLLPEEYYNAPELDEFVVKLNKNADNSILECKGRFTVRVATFNGNHKTVLGGKAAEEDGISAANSSLVWAAESAHTLASLLRRAGFEAYEYHDRSFSCVCVGGFDSLGGNDAAGEFVYAPEIQQVIQKFGGVKEYRNSVNGPVPVPKTIFDVVDWKTFPELGKGTEQEKLAKVKEYSVPLDVMPKAMFVPKPATTGLYRNSLLGQK